MAAAITTATAPTTCGEMLGLLDEAISDLRVAAGETSFAHRSGRRRRRRDRAPTVPMLRAPTPPRRSRTPLPLRKPPTSPPIVCRFFATVVAALDDPRNGLPAAWARPTRRWAVHTIGEEAARRKSVRGADVHDAEARDRRAAGRADVRARASVCSTPWSAGTRSWAGSGPTRSTR